jgi:hypothetical protein
MTLAFVKKRNDPNAQFIVNHILSQVKLFLAYLDESEFSSVHPNRHAWTKIGCQHLILAIRGKRLNVLDALMSSGKHRRCHVC